MPAAPTRLPMFGRCLNGFASSTGSSRFQLASSQGRTTQPLRSSPITGPSTLLRAAPPLHSASVLSPSRLEPLAASPFTPSAWQSTGSHVPYESLVELRAAYMPDAARAVSGHPPSWSRRKGHPPVLTSPNPLSTLLQRFACARLSRPCLPESCSGVSATLTTTALDRSSLRWLGISTDCRTRRALLHLSYSCASPGLMAMLVTHDPKRTTSW